jgi:hypothetical protein
MDETQKWTNLTRANISDLLAKKGFNVSRNIVRKLLKKNGYVKRKPLKNKAGGGHVDRNAQFERIAELKEKHHADGNPVISVDTKKKEFHRCTTHGEVNHMQIHWYLDLSLW